MELPHLPLDRGSERPLAVQLADALRAATTRGELRTGDRLPSTRALASELHLSRTVTAAAYEQLAAEGWVAGKRGSGTFVVGMPAVPRAPAPPPDVPPPVVPSRPPLVDMRAGMPCVEVIEKAAWRRAWRAAADVPADVRVDPQGALAFRTAVVEHLLRLRGLAIEPAEVLATSGSTAAVAEYARTLPAGSRVAVEEPGYQRAVGAIRAAGHEVVPVPVDGQGIVVDALPPDIVAVYCTPAHQFPIGARLSAARRVALIDSARAAGFMILEDDYDGELRYDVAPLPLLAALGPDVVVHVGTTSKLFTPTLGVGWLVAPAAVRAAIVGLRERTGMAPAAAGQRVFRAFADQGDMARHLRKLRRELSDRRAITVAAVGRTVLGDAAGAHIVVPLPDSAERATVRAALRHGVIIDGLTRFHLDPPGASGIVVGYAGPPRSALEFGLGVIRQVLSKLR